MGIAPYLNLTQSGVHQRWMVKADVPAVLAIDAAGYPGRAWDEANLLKYHRDHDTIVMVAVALRGGVVGFIVYTFLRREVRLVRLAVHPGTRRAGVGRAMLAKLLQKLEPGRRDRLTFHVRESNLGACLFYRSAGIRAAAVLPGHYGDEDGYLFVHRAEDVP